jgi:hypothetical protein
MKQPIFVIKQEDVFKIIDRWSLFQRIPYQSYWGTAQSTAEIKDAISKLKFRDATNKTIDVARVCQCIQTFYTNKMPGGANYALDNVIYKINANRISL